MKSELQTNSRRSTRKKALPTVAATSKIEAVARATDRRTKKTTEVIPPDVSRAKAAAWLDLISPLTEWAGLRGDQIRQRRQQLRLEHEDSLIEILSAARQKLQNSDAVIRPIPAKFLIPYLEKASLEDYNTKLRTAWANLFVSAATNFTPKLNAYIEILSTLGQDEAKFLHNLCIQEEEPHAGHFDPVGISQYNERIVKNNIRLLDNLDVGFPPSFDELSVKKVNESKAMDDVLKHIDYMKHKWSEFRQKAQLKAGVYLHGNVLSASALWNFNGSGELGHSSSSSHEVMIELLEREKLVRRKRIVFHGKHSAPEGVVEYAELSLLGFDLVKVCSNNFTDGIGKDGE